MMKYNVKKIESTNTMATTYKSLANTSVSDNTKENGNDTNKDTVTIDIGSLDDVEIDLSQETSTDNKTPAELKAEINKKYGVNAVYYDTDSILCDNSKQNAYVAQYNTNNLTPQPCYIKAYYEGKELTIPHNKYKCRKYAIEYIHNLFMEGVIPYETIFTLHYITMTERITIEDVLETIKEGDTND